MLKRLKGGLGSGGSIFSMGKSKARVIRGEQTEITFKDATMNRRLRLERKQGEPDGSLQEAGEMDGREPQEGMAENARTRISLEKRF